MKLHLFALCIAILAAPTTQAALSSNSNKTAILQEADRCDMLGQEEIVFLTTKPFSEINASLAKTRQLLTNNLQARYTCYQEVIQQLNDYLLSTQQALAQQPLDVAALQQWQIDMGLKEVFTLRQNISQELLYSILRDLEHTPPKADYMQESAKTKHLIQQDLSTLLNHTQRQLLHDEQRLWLEEDFGPDYLQTKLLIASHVLSQAQALFDLDGPVGVIKAKLKTTIASLPGHLAEVLAWPRMASMLDDPTLKAIQAFKERADLLFTQVDSISVGELYEQITLLQDDLLQFQNTPTRP